MRLPWRRRRRRRRRAEVIDGQGDVERERREEDAADVDADVGNQQLEEGIEVEEVREEEEEAEAELQVSPNIIAREDAAVIRRVIEWNRGGGEANRRNLRREAGIWSDRLRDAPAENEFGGAIELRDMIRAGVMHAEEEEPEPDEEEEEESSSSSSERRARGACSHRGQCISGGGRTRTAPRIRTPTPLLAPENYSLGRRREAYRMVM
jgi:hypothetical protein